MKRICCSLVLLILMSLPLVSESKPQEDAGVYFPVGANLVWSYAGEGIEFAEFSRQVEYIQGNRTQMSEYNGATRVMMIFRVTSGTVVKTFSRAEVYDNPNYLREPDNRLSVVLKTPFSVGAAWQDEKDRREIVSIAAKVTVPAGSFENVLAVMITPLAQEAGDQYHQIEYYAPGTGLIMREFIGKDGFRVSSKLKSFGKEKKL